jgi:hypothetical protein
VRGGVAHPVEPVLLRLHIEVFSLQFRVRDHRWCPFVREVQRVTLRVRPRPWTRRSRHASGSCPGR